MLSERERQALREIEQQLAGEDAGFATTMSRPLSNSAQRWTRRGYDAVAVFALLLAVLCFSLSQDGTGGAAAVAAGFAVLVVVVRRRHFPPHPDADRGRTPGA